MPHDEHDMQMHPLTTTKLQIMFQVCTLAALSVQAWSLYRMHCLLTMNVCATASRHAG